MLYWLMKYIILGPLLRLIFRPRVEGLRHVPDVGPVILASNHLSFSDSIFTPLVVKRKVTFIAKAEYFTGKGLKGWLTELSGREYVDVYAQKGKSPPSAEASPRKAVTA
ncbi:hypothetical protein GVV04_23145 [Micromonospora sp. NEAU-HG-1]|nr:1-acyl-sn-glycerol-3-phosphate acyltransferase [Micromonospora rubida]NBE83806.1 hypothetical protein [Micromonospora rubida]